MKPIVTEFRMPDHGQPTGWRCLPVVASVVSVNGKERFSLVLVDPNGGSSVDGGMTPFEALKWSLTEVVRLENFALELAKSGFELPSEPLAIAPSAASIPPNPSTASTSNAEHSSATPGISQDGSVNVDQYMDWLRSKEAPAAGATKSSNRTDSRSERQLPDLVQEGEVDVDAFMQQYW